MAIVKKGYIKPLDISESVIARLDSPLIPIYGNKVKTLGAANRGLAELDERVEHYWLNILLNLSANARQQLRDYVRDQGELYERIASDTKKELKDLEIIFAHEVAKYGFPFDVTINKKKFLEDETKRYGSISEDWKGALSFLEQLE